MNAQIKVVYQFTNETDGLISYVTEYHDKFIVSLKDIDADRMLPTSKQYDSLSKAKEYALQIVGE